MATSADTGETAGEGAATEHHGAPKRETLARTGPLLALLPPIFLVFGLATLAGFTTSTGALIGALAALLIMTVLVIGGVLKLADQPPEDEDEDLS
ncbi:MAG TPA: hypothetical protein VGF95_05200 [Solirubrobacteraceae bacterium]|jgi:threonine/homoserine/homoserine lactone efflux protein